MAEYEHTEEKIVGINEPITFINNTKSPFTVGVGIMFHEDGAYQVLVNNGEIQVDRICRVKEKVIKMSELKPCPFPTIEPERKKGKWIHGRELSREMIGDVVTAIFYEGWECSECHCLVQEEREPLWNFCPSCGADMRGETQNE